MKYLEIVWKDALGKKQTLGRMSHQHLSNIYWFFKVFNSDDPLSKKSLKMVEDVLEYRFGKIKSWKPLPIPGEINLIKSCKYCNIYTDGTIVLYGKPIGSLKHIPNWKSISI
jgi:hypothetical protein